MDIYEIYVKDLNGKTHKLQAPQGYRVMEVIRDNGLPIKAECQGACACATCHVYIAPQWLDKLYPPGDEEMNMLDEAFNIQENSRLSCQIIMNQDLDGLELKLAQNF